MKVFGLLKNVKIYQNICNLILLVRVVCIRHPLWHSQAYLAIVHRYFLLRALLFTHFGDNQEADFQYATVF